MKQLIFTFALLCSLLPGYAQKSVAEQYKRAISFQKEEKLQDAYDVYKTLYPELKTTDTIYQEVVWNYSSILFRMVKGYLANEDYTNMLKYSLEAVKLIEDNTKYMDAGFLSKLYWMTKDVVVAYTGLNEEAKAKKHKDILYKAYHEKQLPKGLDRCFNFDFFKLDGKNIWGYEWYPELPDDRASSSFTKVVYYVYSTKPDGTDDEQLYRFHVLMFHKMNNDVKFDYILERQIDTDSQNISGSYYKYTYNKDIDYKKLKADIIEIVKHDIQPDSKRVVNKRK